MTLRHRSFLADSTFVANTIFASRGTFETAALFKGPNVAGSRQSNWARRGSNVVGDEDAPRAWLEASALDLRDALQKIEDGLPDGALEAWLAAFEE